MLCDHIQALKRPRGRPPRPPRGATSKSVPKVAQEDDTQPSELEAMEPNAAIVQEVTPTRKRVTRSRATEGEASEGLAISNADAPVRRSTRTNKSAASESARLEDIPGEWNWNFLLDWHPRHRTEQIHVFCGDNITDLDRMFHVCSCNRGCADKEINSF